MPSPKNVRSPPCSEGCQENSPTYNSTFVISTIYLTPENNIVIWGFYYFYFLSKDAEVQKAYLPRNGQKRSQSQDFIPGLIDPKAMFFSLHEVTVVQSLSCVQLFVTPQTATRQASLSITNTWSLLKLMPSNHLILCRPLLLLTSIFPSIRVFSNELALCIRWPK